MKTLTGTQLTALKNPHKFECLLSFKIGDTWHYLTDASSNRNEIVTYYAGYIEEVGDIEVSSEPKIDDINPVLNLHDNAYVGLFLGSEWLNQPFQVHLLHIDNDGDTILKTKVFDGLIASISMSETKRTVKLTVAPAFANQDQTAGISTNEKSQQRFYPNDTAFRHSSDAVKKVYWGKDAPSAATGSGSGGASSGGVVGSLDDILGGDDYDDPTDYQDII